MTQSDFTLFCGQEKTVVMRDIPLVEMRISRFNTRKTRPREHVERLAQRIVSNGFEQTRALWVYPAAEGGYEIFAGGTRFQAAKLAELIEVPCFIHEGLSDEEIARLADVDNENDEYHAKVPILDVWAEYWRLWKEEGWTQQQIADAKGVDKGTSSLRCKLHQELSPVAKKACLDELLEEGHCIAIISLSLDVQTFDPWLTTTQAQTELTQSILQKHRGSSKGDKPTVKYVRDQSRQWKEMIARAEALYQDLAKEGEGWQVHYVGLLARSSARTEAKVNAAYAKTLNAIENAKRAESERLRAEASAAEKARVEAEKEARRQALILEFTQKIVLGDAAAMMTDCPQGFQLLLTDPPYGQHYQSGRRKTSQRKDRMQGDVSVETASDLLARVATKAFDKMAANSIALVFCTFRNQIESRFAKVLEAAGFKVRSSLVFVKNNHGAGDLARDFAPRHERILYAVKGDPLLPGSRIEDVLYGADRQNSDHPTEKPQDLLVQLIQATTEEGDIVVDPFSGSGATLFAANSVSRDFWGCEIEPEWHSKIESRLLSIAEEVS